MYNKTVNAATRTGERGVLYNYTFRLSSVRHFCASRKIGVISKAMSENLIFILINI